MSGNNRGVTGQKEPRRLSCSLAEIPETVDRGCWDMSWSARIGALNVRREPVLSYQIPFAGREALNRQEYQKENEAKYDEASSGASLSRKTHG